VTNSLELLEGMKVDVLIYKPLSSLQFNSHPYLPSHQLSCCIKLQNLKSFQFHCYFGAFLLFFFFFDLRPIYINEMPKDSPTRRSDKSSSSKKGSAAYIHVWSCCNCGLSAAMLVKTTTHCPECGVKRCNNCQIDSLLC
jgi:hypothetical protein